MLTRGNPSQGEQSQVLRVYNGARKEAGVADEELSPQQYVDVSP